MSTSTKSSSAEPKVSNYEKTAYFVKGFNAMIAEGVVCNFPTVNLKLADKCGDVLRTFIRGPDRELSAIFNGPVEQVDPLQFTSDLDAEVKTQWDIELGEIKTASEMACAQAQLLAAPRFPFTIESDAKSTLAFLINRVMSEALSYSDLLTDEICLTETAQAALEKSEFSVIGMMLDVTSVRKYPFDLTPEHYGTLAAVMPAAIFTDHPCLHNDLVALVINYVALLADALCIAMHESSMRGNNINGQHMKVAMIRVFHGLDRISKRELLTSMNGVRAGARLAARFNLHTIHSVRAKMLRAKAAKKERTAKAVAKLLKLQQAQRDASSDYEETKVASPARVPVGKKKKSRKGKKNNNSAKLLAAQAKAQREAAQAEKDRAAAREAETAAAFDEDVAGDSEDEEEEEEEEELDAFEVSQGLNGATALDISEEDEATSEDDEGDMYAED